MKKRALQFAASAAVYCTIEIAARGYTHWTMALTGGVCGMILFMLSDNFPNVPIWALGVLGSVFITLAEVLVGTIVNLYLGWHVWDYSDRWGNILGQICPLFTFLWFLLSSGVLFVMRAIKKIRNNKEERRSKV
ncbi:MAG: hypothetical protein EOM30_12380 [Clostridia bacterium]|nr:hypothetical protein [Clostridia bacterium]NLS84022.1 hypothetical protein [Oscillospiraceae bacterium]